MLNRRSQGQQFCPIRNRHNCQCDTQKTTWIDNVELIGHFFSAILNRSSSTTTQKVSDWATTINCQNGEISLSINLAPWQPIMCHVRQSLVEHTRETREKHTHYPREISRAWKSFALTLVMSEHNHAKNFPNLNGVLTIISFFLSKIVLKDYYKPMLASSCVFCQ
jgi:hypothetical protein